MGYCIDLIDHKFKIPASETEQAFNAILDLMEDPEADRSGLNHEKGSVFSWMHSAEPFKWTSLDDAMEEWRFPVHRDSWTNDVVAVEFTGEKIGDEKQMFDVIAPYVVDGSYLHFRGEDGKEWRIEFDGNGITEVEV